MSGEIESAVRKKAESGLLGGSTAHRLFHGPGEGEGWTRSIAIDRFGDYAWCTFWQKPGFLSPKPEHAEEVRKALEAQGLKGAVLLSRPEKKTPELPQVWFGEVPESRFEVRERDARFWVNLRESLHPGLFLDHVELRRWLEVESEDRSVLNLFSYTGSLSVAAGLGKARLVKSVDLSRPFSNWAKENWALNALDETKGDFVVGDSFDWLSRFQKRSEHFDTIVLDPPSFSRGPSGVFSTQKDLKRLHLEAIRCLSPKGGILVSSINSVAVERSRFENEVEAAVREAGFRMKIVRKISQPATFPIRRGDSESAYLKGLIAEISGN